ncbi:hypothetical protein [Micromonospora sp. A200]|uniref:hypothetical protein n=1 Tax=Micromonospora sp. A200 TaxID=2940568 RepID=UPI00247464C1|nr:hypothetical protein [Micromonospora sp. A200]
MHVDTNRPEASVVDVALIQGLHPLAEPMVSLTSIGGPAAEHIVMSTSQARVLTYKVRQLLDGAKGGAR